MSALEWEPEPCGLGAASSALWRRYCLQIDDRNDLLLFIVPACGRHLEPHWYVQHRPSGFDVVLPGNNLPDAEAQALAVPTLVKALKAVLERLEGRLL